jgi:hypothetical protein
MPTVRQQALQKIREALELGVDPLSLDMPVSVANEIKRILQEKPKKKAPRVKQPKQPKQSKSQNVKQSVKQTAKQQTQSTKQNVLVTVKNIINRRARQAPKQETRDTVMLQPKASMFGNNMLTGNVSRYVQPAMSFAVAPPQFQPIQSAIVDKPIAKVVPPKQQPDVFAGEETNPYDITPSYTPKPAPDLPVPRVGDLAVASASSSGFRFTPQPPPPPSRPAESMGPAQAVGAPAMSMEEAIYGPPLYEGGPPTSFIEAGEPKKATYNIFDYEGDSDDGKDEVEAGALPQPIAGQLTGQEAVNEWIRSASGKDTIGPTKPQMRNWLEKNVYGGQMPPQFKNQTQWVNTSVPELHKLLYENRAKIQRGAMKTAGNAPWPI